MEKLLQENSEWREVVSNLNNEISKLFDKSKDLRIHQSADVTGDIHFTN